MMKGSKTTGNFFDKIADQVSTARRHPKDQQMRQELLDRQPHHLIVTKVDDDSFGANEAEPAQTKNVFRSDLNTLRRKDSNN